MNKNASAADPTPERDRSNVLLLKGEIDLHVSPSVTASLNSMIEKKPQRLVVDLSGVSYIDSAGLAALIGAMYLLCPTIRMTWKETATVVQLWQCASA